MAFDVNKLKWYNLNFSNEEIIYGKNTQFFRFQNLMYKFNNNSGNTGKMWILPIPEIINIKTQEYDNYRNEVFFNGTDIIDIQKILKSDTNYTETPFFIYGGPETGTQITPQDFAFNLNNYKVEVLNNIFIDILNKPIIGYDVNYQEKNGEKHSFRFDYNGNKSLIVKITFIIFTENPTINNFWNVNTTPLPVIVNIAPSNYSPKKGDVQYDNNGIWEYHNGSGWNELLDNVNENPVYGVKHLHEKGFYMPSDNWNGMWLDYQEVYLMCYPESKFKFSRNKYWIDKSIFKQQIYDDKSSFMVLRTNPKLSGNIKIVVDSENTMYLDTIEANDELSDAKYKKNKINPKSDFCVDIKKYFGNISPEILYEVKQKDKFYENTKKEFIEQYDFFYGYGASQQNSKYYKEKYKLFAPIWLRKDLPDFFVIFKVPGSVNKETYFNNNKEIILKEMLKDAHIIQVYDMRQGSTIGEYIRKIVNDERFQEQPLKISYEKDVLSTWFGVSYKEGIMTEKGEFLYDFFRTDNTINEFEEYITNGFERNQLISTNLINFEFLFDDETNEDYSINRYFGIYVKEIELCKFKIYTNGIKKIINQNPLPKNNVDGEVYSTRDFIQTNETGIVIPIKYYQGNNSIGEPEFKGDVEGKLPLKESVSDPFRFFYIKDKNNNFYRIKELKEYEFGNINFQNYDKFTGLKLYNKQVNISNFTGITQLTGQYTSKLLNKGYSQIVINFKDKIKELEFLEIEWIDLNNNKQLWRCIANSTGLQPGDAWDYPVYNPDQFLYVNTFSPEGSLEDIAKAFTICLNKFENKIFTAYCDKTNVYIRTNFVGKSGNGIIFRRKMVLNSLIHSLYFYDIKTNYKPNFIKKEFNGIGNSENLVKLWENEIGKVNEYEIKILDIYNNGNNNYIKFNIKKNGGNLGDFVKQIGGTSITENQIFTYNNINIEWKFDNNNNISYAIGDTWIIGHKYPNIEQRFIGGTDRNRNRAAISIKDALNINPKHWFQIQKNKYSNLKIWDVQDKEIFKLPDLEEPIFDSSNNIIGYKNINKNVIIQIEDENSEFYQSNERKIVCFDVFKPIVGVLSFLPVKDFDFDWHISDYAYTPNGELFEFYERYELNENEYQELEFNQSYEIKSGSVKLQGWNSNIQQWEDISIPESKFWQYTIDNKVIFGNISKINVFNTYLPTYYYETNKEKSNKKNINQSQNIENYFYRNYKELEYLNIYTKLRCLALEDNTVIEKFTYNQDINLKEFTGFLGLSDFFSIEDEYEFEKLLEKNDINRFFINQLFSEYDRLRENFNKNYAVKSRVVPFINKWVQTGTDCRDNKYRLNNSLAFGITNFSPDTEIKERNPGLHTHEFYYLDKFPTNFADDLLSNSRSYFFEPLSKIVYNNKSWYELFKEDLTQDWFSKYFIVGYPTEIDKNNKKVIKKKEERYVFTEYVPGDESVQCLFRGAKFKIIDIDPITNKEIKNSKKYEGYKFSSILQIKKLAFDTTEPPTELEFIANEKYKTIVFVITLYVSDYRLNGGNYGYTFLYAGNDGLKSFDVKAGDKDYFLNKEGDINISYVHPNFLNTYGVQRHFDSFRGGTILQYSDIKLNGILNISQPINAVTRILDAISITNKDFDPSEEIFPISWDEFNIKEIYNKYGIVNPYIDILEQGGYSEFSHFIKYQISNNNILKFVINTQPNINQEIEITPQSIIITNENKQYTAIGNNFLTEFPTCKKHYQFQNYMFGNYDKVSCWYLSGGKDYIKRRLEEISFAEIANKINNNDSSVKYYTITENGLIENKYKFQVIDFDKIIKKDRLIIKEDTEKPDVFQEIDIIGFELERTNENEVIFRHRGKFEPKTKDVINFWLREDELMTQHFNVDYLLCNTRWHVEYDNFGYINNLYYNKVGNENLMKISTETKFKSLYPLINEISIDKKDYFVFNSNWDNNYFQFYETRFGKKDIKKFGEIYVENIEGTEELREQKSFFGSKIMNTPYKFIIHTFNENEIKYWIEQSLSSTDIDILKKEKKKILPEGNKNKIIIEIDVKQRLLREMIENNAANEFFKLKQYNITRFSNMTDDEILKETQKYLLQNIIPLYKIKDIIFYEKEDADKNEDEIVRFDLSHSEKKYLNYKQTKNMQIKQINDFKFRIIREIDTKKFKSFTVSIILERI